MPRRLITSTLLLFLLVIGPQWSGPARLPLFGRTLAITTRPVPLYPDDPARKDLGALVYLGGISLSSDDPAFGGFSGMTVRHGEVTLISDGGNYVRFRMTPARTVRDVHYGALPAGPTASWRKRDRNSEAVTLDPATGQLWVAFERHNRVWRYDAALMRGEAEATPAAMASWSRNLGAEAMVRLADGRFVILGEERDEQGTVPGILFDRDPTRSDARTRLFRYRPPPGFRPTDMAALPDGRLLVLDRTFNFPFRFRSVVSIVDARAFRTGSVLSGRIIARFESPAIQENFEAMAITHEAGEAILWIASDDNQLALQRSLLLKFRLPRQLP